MWIALAAAVPVTQDALLISVGNPAIVLGAMGLVLGLGLAFAAKKLAVFKDPLIERIEAVLPGVNCGGCGYPGCTPFAEAVVKGEAPVNGCVAAGSSINAEIAEIVGGDVSDRARRIALVHCNGGHSAGDAFEYRGPLDCASAMMVMNGAKVCTYGCLGYGDCARSCLFNAMEMGENGVPVVNGKACTGCGKCIAACPRKLIELWPDGREVVVACANRERGGIARKACGAACIGCRKCVKVCPAQAVAVSDFLAVIDPLKCINCGLCAAHCPTGAIIDNAPARPKAYIDGSCIGCTICARVCLTGAIAGNLRERHVITGKKCVGCGLCLPKCPKNSIRMIGALSYRRGEEFEV